MKKAVLKRTCDKLFSEKIREAGVCAKCGSREYLQCAHIVSRRYLQTRFDLDNALCLCRGCHLFSHTHPAEWEVWLEDTLGRKYLKKLRDKALAYGKIDYEEIIYKLKKL